MTRVHILYSTNERHEVSSYRRLGVFSSKEKAKSNALNLLKKDGVSEEDYDDAVNMLDFYYQTQGLQKNYKIEICRLDSLEL